MLSMTSWRVAVGLLVMGLVAVGASGCVVVPGPYAVAGPPVVVAPPPVVVAPAPVYGYHGYYGRVR